MGIAIQMFFNKEAENIILDYWLELNEIGLYSQLYEMKSRPHISLAVYEDGIDMNILNKKLKHFLYNKEQIKLQVNKIGKFDGDTCVVFMALISTNILLDFHREYHFITDDLSEYEWQYYLPDNWIPHCTIAMDIPREQASEIVEYLSMDFEAFDCTIEEIGIVEFRPIKHLWTYTLKNNI